ncbi:MAG: hypothetical protein RSD13_06305 [Clostridium sp.]
MLSNFKQYTLEKVLKVKVDTDKLSEIHNNNSIELNLLSEFIKKSKECDYEDFIEYKIVYAYINIGSISRTKDYINELGYRIKSNGKTGERKYSTNDISEIINNEYKGANEKIKELYNMAKILYVYSSNSNYGKLLPIDFKVEY